MIVNENFCNGCKECVHCSLGEKREILHCDACSEIIDDVYYELDGESLCSECARDWANDNFDELMWQFSRAVSDNLG